MITVELCPGCQLPRAEVGHKWQHDCTEELRRELNKVLIQLKIIRDEFMLQYNQKRISDFNQVRNQAFEEAANCVEGDNCRDLHDGFCSLYGDADGCKCDCHIKEISQNIRSLKHENR